MKKGFAVAALILATLVMLPEGFAESAGEGEMPDISVSPARFEFRTVTVFDLTDKTFTVSNAGTGELVISAISLADTRNFILNLKGGPSPCASPEPTIPPGGACTFAVTFRPKSEGVLDTTLSIVSNDPDTPNLGVPIRAFALACQC